MTTSTTKQGRFWAVVRTSVKNNVTDYFAYLKDRQTGMSFSNVFDSEEEGIKWIQKNIRLLKEGKPTDTTKFYPC